jgi:hypothetical protein
LNCERTVRHATFQSFFRFWKHAAEMPYAGAISDLDEGGVSL